MSKRSTSDFLVFAFENSVREQASLWDNWKVIEGKAQTTSGAAGIYVAAGFAYMVEKAARLGWPERVLGALLLILLACSLLQAIRAIRVRSAASPHIGLRGMQEVQEILGNTLPPDSLDARYDNLLRDTISRWAEANSKLEKALDEKGVCLGSSQTLLLWSVVLAIPLIGLAVWPR